MKQKKSFWKIVFGVVIVCMLFVLVKQTIYEIGQYQIYLELSDVMNSVEEKLALPDSLHRASIKGITKRDHYGGKRVLLPAVSQYYSIASSLSLFNKTKLALMQLGWNDVVDSTGKRIVFSESEMLRLDGRILYCFRNKTYETRRIEICLSFFQEKQMADLLGGGSDLSWVGFRNYIQTQPYTMKLAVRKY